MTEPTRSTRSFRGRCGGLRRVEHLRREPSETELEAFRAGLRPEVIQGVYGRWVVASGVVGVLGWVFLGQDALDLSRVLGSLELFVVLAASLLVGFVAVTVVVRRPSYTRRLWCDAQRERVTRGALPPVGLAHVEMAGEVSLSEQDGILSWSLDVDGAEVLGPAPGGARSGEELPELQLPMDAGGELALIGGRGVSFELTRDPDAPGAYSLACRAVGSGAGRGLVLELDRSHLVSDEAAAGLEALRRGGLRLSPDATMLLLNRLRPIVEALGTPLPPAIGERRRDVHGVPFDPPPRPDDPDPLGYYARLGVSPKADAEAIKQAFRQTLASFWPQADQTDPANIQRFTDLNEAYAALSDVDKRAAYDAGRLHDPNAVQLEDIFNQLGGLMGGMFGSQPGAMARGADLSLQISIDLREAVAGLEKVLEIPGQRPCQACGGLGDLSREEPRRCEACQGRGKVHTRQGFFELAAPCADCKGSGYLMRRPCRRCDATGSLAHSETVTVKIPRGVDDGIKLRLPGKGLPGQRGGEAGDLYIEIAVRPDPIVRRDGADLHVDAPASASLMRDGGRLKARVFDREVAVDVPPGTRVGDVITVEGEGAPDVKTGQRGALKVRVGAG